MTHYQIGGKLLQQWKFPKQVTIQVFRHHNPWKDQDFTSGTFIIFLADILTKIAGFPCLDSERQFTIEEFCKSKALHIINQHNFKIDCDLLEHFLIQVQEFATYNLPEKQHHKPPTKTR